MKPNEFVTKRGQFLADPSSDLGVQEENRQTGQVEDVETSNGGSNMQAGADAEALIRMARSELRRVDESQFTPLVVPIGPYHHARECSSERAEEKKKHAADKVLRPGYQKRAHTMDQLHTLVDKAMACYPDLSIRNSRLLTNSKEFVQMLLHDGCYVLSFLVDYSHTHEAGIGSPDVMREENWVLRDILFLVENQIPWFVLKKLHHCIVGNEDRSALDDLSQFVRLLLQDRLHISTRRRRLPSASDPSTLLHLVHAYFMPTQVPSTEASQATQPQHVLQIPEESPPANTEAPSTPAQGATVAAGESSPDNTARGEEERHGATVVEPRVPSPRCRMGRWRRAAEYCRYGNVKLRHRNLVEGVADSVLDVSLQGRTLLMPCLLIDSTTWTILRNLMALEESMNWRPATAYCVFMSQLACKVEDVELLQRAGIVQNFLGNDDELVQGFADLCKEVVLDVDSPNENYLNPTWHRLEQRCHSKVNNFCGFFREIHGASYVHKFAFVGAVSLFLFQLVQVILTGFSLPKPK